MDIVYLVKNNQVNNSQELRYSLRSLQNIPHGKVFLVGEKPDWVTGVEYISVLQNRTKAQNVGANMRAAVASDAVSDDFILMNDDFFIMKPISNLPTLNFGPMSDVIADYDRRYPEGSKYIDTMKELYRLLLSRNIAAPISYELHIPMAVNKHNIREMYGASDRVYQMRSYYGNAYALGGEQTEDVKIFLDERHNPSEYNKYPEQYLREQTFLSATGGAFNRGLVGEYIRSQLHTPSPYELRATE